jgi:hypothetical protein
LVEVPFRRKDDKPRVRKVCFAAATDWSDEVRDGYNQPVTVDDDDIRRHMAPDPILVVSKAAAIFAARHHQKFAAGAEPEEEDLLDTLAHEQFWESLQATLRPPEDRTELARALGQLHDTQDPKM